MFLARLFYAVFVAIATVVGIGIAISFISVLVVVIRHQLGFQVAP